MFREFKNKTEMFVDKLDVEDVIAQLLVTEGYTSIHSIANENTSNLEKIEGFDSDLANELSQRASNYVKEEDEANLKIINEKNVSDDLRNLEGINNKMLALLAENNVVNLNDFAELANYDLIDKEEGIFKSLEIDEKTINTMIMKARENWFDEEKKI